MKLFLRVAWTSAVLLLVSLGTTAFPQGGRPPGGIRPNPGQPKLPVPGGAGGRVGMNIGVPGGGFQIAQPVPGGGGIPGFNMGKDTISPTKTPAQVQNELRPLITSKPTEVFTRLRGNEGQVLGEPAKLALAREAAEKVALKAESGKPIEAVSEIRAARAAAIDMPAEIRTLLERASQGAERRLLAEGLEVVRARAAGGQWAETAKAAREWLGELNDPRLATNRHLESPEFRARLTECREALERDQTLADRFDAVARFATTLAGLEGMKPRVIARELGAVDRGNLPTKLARQLDCLRGLAELQELAGNRWDISPDVGEVKASVARLERGFIEVSDADTNLGKHLLQDLAVKALLEGHPDTALKLLPEGGPADHAARLLADLHALTLGEGTVKTWPAKAAADQGKPPGLTSLMREGWKPPQKDKQGDPTAIQKAEAIGTAITTQAGKAVPAERSALDARAAEVIKSLAALHDRIMAPELVQRKGLAAVEAELDRRLKPAERVRVRVLLEQKKSPPQIAEELKAVPAQEGEDEKEFIADLEKRLGRPVIDERPQALRLRKQGRTAAEVADIIRR